MPVLLALAVGTTLVAIGAAVTAIRSYRARNRLRAGFNGFVALALIGVAFVASVLAVATHGFRAFTREEIAATVEVRPTGEHRFEATVDIPDKKPQTYRLRGDQIYVDAHILKWEPFLNVMGLHTAYELDRIGGRYENIEMARNAERTVHRLGDKRMVDIYELAEQFPLLGRVVDAEYGSATFVEVDANKRLEVRVSTSGLLIREADGRTNRND